MGKDMKKTRKKVCALVMAAAMVVGSLTLPGQADAKTKVKLSKKKLTLTVGQKKKLKVKGTKKKVKWSSTKKKVATVSKKGVINAKKKGTAKIVAKIGKKKYVCKVTVKAKKAVIRNTPKAVSTPKATKTPVTSMKPDSSAHPDSSANPDVTPSPGTTSKPDSSTKPAVTPSPGQTNAPSASDTPQVTTVPTSKPDATAVPSEEDGEKTPGKIELGSLYSWNNFRVNPGQVTVDAGASVVLSYSDILDGTIWYTNTYGNTMTMEALKANEGTALGQGFWTEKCRPWDSIPLTAGTTNTIYVRLVNNDTGEVYYLNSDNIVVRSAEPDVTPAPSGEPTAAPTTAPTAVPSTSPSGTAGKNIDLQGKTAFQADTYQLALGLTKAEVNTVLGSLTNDVKREEKSPQGFDVIAYRVNGNNTSVGMTARYQTYILVYLKNDVVVGITAIAPSVSYGSEIQSGTAASTLASNGWSAVDWYADSNGNAGAYTKESNGARMIAYVDSLDDSKVYGVQVFNSSYNLDSMINPSQVTDLNYADTCDAMAKETEELLNAYLVYKGVSPKYINDEMKTAAKAYSQEVIDMGVTDASSAARASSEIKSWLTNYGAKPNSKWSERIFMARMDAVGFACAAIGEQTTRTQLIGGSVTYSVMGIGSAGAYDDSGIYYPNLVIELVDFVKD